MAKWLMALMAITLFIACDQEEQQGDTQSPSELFTELNSTSEISIDRQDGVWLVKRNVTDYRFIPNISEADTTPMILKIQEFENTVDGESIESGFTVTGQIWKGEGFEKESWKISRASKEFDQKMGWVEFMENGHMIGNEYGDATYFLYDLKTGKPLIDFTYDRLTINVMSDPKDYRLLTYSSRLTAGETQNRFQADSMLVGLVRYSGADGIIDELEIRLKDIRNFNLVPPYTPQLELKSSAENAQLMNYNKSILLWPNASGQMVFSDYAIKLTYFIGQTYREVQMVIPVNRDQINVNDIIFDDALFELVLITE